MSLHMNNHIFMSNRLSAEMAVLSDRSVLCPICNIGVLCPNNWMDQDEVGMEVGLRPGHFVSDGGTAPPNFRPMSVVVNGWMDQDATW